MFHILEKVRGAVLHRLVDRHDGLPGFPLQSAQAFDIYHSLKQASKAQGKDLLPQDKSVARPRTSHQMFRLLDNRRLVCAFDRSTRHTLLHFYGVASITVLRGTISCLGHVLRSGHSPKTIYSPRTHAFQALLYHGDGLEDYSGPLDEYYCVFEMRSYEEDPFLEMEAFAGLRMVPSAVALFSHMFRPPPGGSQAGASRQAPQMSTFMIFDSQSNGLPFQVPISGFVTIPPVWTGLANSMRAAKAPRVLICGDRKTGKSTLVRFILNSLLDKSPTGKVLSVDFDVGQTETSPCGLVVANLMGEPLLGTPLTHQRVPDVGEYYGSTSVSDIPASYAAICQSVYTKAARSLGTSSDATPQVINTMGWVTGLGAELLKFHIQLTRPTHIVCIQGEEAKADGKGPYIDFGKMYLHQESYYKGVAPIDYNMEIACIPMIASIQRTTNSNPRDHPQEQPSKPTYSPADQREILNFCYFHAKFNDQGSHLTAIDTRPLTKHRAFSAPFQLINPQSCVPGTPALRVECLKATMVGLITSTGKCLGQGIERCLHDQLPCLILYLFISLCVGLVRGVDLDKQLLYILSPLPLSIIKQVSTLMAGYDCAIPAYFLNEDEEAVKESTKDPPYLSTTGSRDFYGQEAHVVRRNIARIR